MVSRSTHSVISYVLHTFDLNCLPLTYPEVNLQVSATAKLSVADLKRNRHLVVLVQRFMETFALVSLHLDVVCRGK